jgi:ADP-ribosylglycohydrolase
MLLEIAVGDAYGAGFEFVDLNTVKRFNNLSHYRSHNLGIKAGSYTDDTQMTLALSELMIDCHVWSKEIIADKFVVCYQRDKRLGYATGFGQLLDSVANGQELLSRIRPDSIRNGAAMRAAPIGLYHDIDEVMEKAKLQATITHDTEIGIRSSQAIALSTHYFYYRLGDRESFYDFICEKTNLVWDKEWHKMVRCDAFETVSAVLTLLMKYNRYSDLLRESVQLSGDVDTVAALTLGVASCAEHYYTNDLPELLIETLEDGDFGKNYIISLDEKLMERFKKEVCTT